jgi:hypothetical protein
MNTLEERIRTAITQTAEEITPGSIPPLSLATPQRRRLGAAGRGRGRAGWPRVLIPLAAAASVTAVVVTSVAVSGGTNGHRPTKATGHISVMASLPPYYVMITGNNPNPTVLQPEHAVIRATSSGATLATITPPSPYGTFVLVAGAGDGHTFVLAAEKWAVQGSDGGGSQLAEPTKFFLLRINPATGKPRLTALPIPAEPASVGLSGMALSPGARKLAVAVDGNGNRQSIQVFTVATGSEQQWTWQGGGNITNNAGGNGQVLSWAADQRTLAFQVWQGKNIEVRLFNTASAAGLQASTVAVNFPGAAVDSPAGDVTFGGTGTFITPDGTMIVCATTSTFKWSKTITELGYTEFSASTGRAVRILDLRRYPKELLQTQDVLWTNASGSTLIVVANVPGARPGNNRLPIRSKYHLQIGVVTGNSFRPLPGLQMDTADGPVSYPAW